MSARRGAGLPGSIGTYAAPVLRIACSAATASTDFGACSTTRSPREFGNLDASGRIARDTFFIGVHPGLTDEMLAYAVERFFADSRLNAAAEDR